MSHSIADRAGVDILVVKQRAKVVKQLLSPKFNIIPVLQ